MISLNQMKKINKKNTGYTIIETMISVSLFVVIVIAGTGALLNANLLHNKSQNMRSIMDNLNFIMEDLSRDLRMGYNYRCYHDAGNITGDPNINSARSCATGWGIAFESNYPVIGDPIFNGDQWAYYIDSGKIYKSTNGAASFIPLTPDEVVIESTSIVPPFSVLGAEPPIRDPLTGVIIGGNLQQPFVTIKLVGTITYKNVVTSFSLQTAVSQRSFDI